MDTNYHLCNPEIWGGIECTINRIGDKFRDQLHYAGHYSRKDDISIIAQLGISAIRYPVLWEAHQSENEDQVIDWHRTSEQLEQIRSHNIIPIAGLVHHGSGPAFTNLMDDRFPGLLAGYALKVATQFPWLEYYTPVNEPLTTARFSGLYGCWYPHERSDKSFARMLINQLTAIVLSMKAIRTVNPSAKLVQTEDLSKTHSSLSLKYQADHENLRRWLTYDILCGKLTRTHPFWKYFISKGIPKEMLEFFLENPCPPDVAGFNYYVTSERYLDKRVSRFPRENRGGNRWDVYADVPAVRARKPSGLKKLLEEAWERFKLPMALTEVHMNCTREEQMRWFKEAWDICCSLKKSGINIKAVTAWSLLGAYDWDSLLMREQGHYESGVFDINKTRLRSTALTKLVTSLANTGDYQHPLLEEKGWWHRSYPKHNNQFNNSKRLPLLIFGSTGTLGTAFVKMCEIRSIPYCAFSHSQLDITKTEEVEAAIRKWKPWAIINASGYVKVDDAESDVQQCFKLNAEVPANLASICNKYGLQFVTFSSDLVFDGLKLSPYIELDSVKPINVYGHSKAKGEEAAISNFSSSLIIRTSAFFGPWDRYNFVFNILKSLKEKEKCVVVNDVIVSPTYVPDLVDKTLDLLIDEENGIWHLTNDGSLTWHEFAEEVADRKGYNKKYIASCSQEEMNWKARRPQYSALQSEKGILLPPLQEAIGRYFDEKIN
jgi:dTDP-4-dehydrorhamnose reductase